MRKGIVALVSSIIVLAALMQTAAKTVPTEASLIEAWETVQRSDPQTETFEKIADRRYRFKTRRFAFAGELQVLNAVINDRLADTEDGYIHGVIEYDLVGLPKDTPEKYSTSYALWQENNKLYFDDQAGTWIDATEYRARWIKRARTGDLPNRQTGNQKTWVTSLLTFSPIIIFVVAWMWLSRRHDRKRLEQEREKHSSNREYLQRYHEHMERVERLLERIAGNLDSDKQSRRQGTEGGGDQPEGQQSN